MELMDLELDLENKKVFVVTAYTVYVGNTNNNEFIEDLWLLIEINFKKN